MKLVHSGTPGKNEEAGLEGNASPIPGGQRTHSSLGGKWTTGIPKDATQEKIDTTFEVQAYRANEDITLDWIPEIEDQTRAQREKSDTERNLVLMQIAIRREKVYSRSPPISNNPQVS